LVASGTATLELALLKVPMVVAYKVDALSFALAKQLVKVPHVSLVNLVLGREAVSERLQNQCTPEFLAQDLRELMADGPRRTAMLAEFESFTAALGEGGSMDRTAAYLLQE
jgi:lipid-A-disaccharide synthase